MGVTAPTPITRKGEINMEEKGMSLMRQFLAETGGKVIFEAQNRVTLTRVGSAAKKTKDLDEPGVVGVEVSCYGATAGDALTNALGAFLDACAGVDK